ncbi:MAG: GNAT family N-acetyltransferase [Chloroflexota bacterium]
MPAIRRVKPGEGLRFRKIRLRALADSPSAFGSTLAEASTRPPEYWEQRTADGAAGEDSVLFVAEADERWLGVVGGITDTTGVELISMWVEPAYRKIRLGRQLVDQILVWARERNADYVSLCVSDGNESAIKLYELCGFRLTGRSQPLPSNPSTLEHFMRLDLKQD